MKQDPRAWFSKMDDYLHKVGFQRSESDDTLYVHLQWKNLVILVMYVDDLIITGNNNEHIVHVKKELPGVFKMAYFVLLHYYWDNSFPSFNKFFVSKDTSALLKKKLHLKKLDLSRCFIYLG
jgi:hypothetical protein